MEFIIRWSPAWASSPSSPGSSSSSWTAGGGANSSRSRPTFHSKVLEKMGSTAEFGAFLETDGGKRFMKSLTVEGPSAKTRILGSTQTGIVCTGDRPGAC